MSPSSSIRLGIAPINWCNDDMPMLGMETSIETCFTEMREAGYTGTEMGHKYPKDVTALRQLLEHFGLQLASCWHSTFYANAESHSQQHEALEARLEFLTALGCQRINLAECTRSIHGQKTHVLRNKPSLSSREWLSFLQGLDRAGELCQRHGVTMAYHHHMGTVVQSAEEIQRLLQESDPQKVQLCLDTGHLTYAGADPLACLEAFYPRISHVHLKDVRASVLSQHGQEISFLDAVLAGIFTVPGDGMIDFSAFVKRLLQLGYCGWLIIEAEQDPAKAHPFTYAQKAYQHLQGILAQAWEKKENFS